MKFFMQILYGLLILTLIGENVYLNQKLDEKKILIAKLRNKLEEKIWEIQILEEQLKK